MTKDSFKRLFTRVTLVAAVFCLAAFAWADNNVSQPQSESTQSYTVTTSAELFEAVKSAGSEATTIFISGTISPDQPVEISADQTITLVVSSGQTLDFTNVSVDHNDLYGIKNSGTLTISGNGTIKSANKNHYTNGGALRTYIVYNYKGATLNVEGCTLTIHGHYPFDSKSWHYAYTIYNYGTMTMTGGKIDSSADHGAGIYTLSSGTTFFGGSADIYTYGNNSDPMRNQGGTINMTGGTLRSYVPTNNFAAVGIRNEKNGTLNISGGTISADAAVKRAFAVWNEKGTLNITGGKFYATGKQDSMPTAAVYNQKTATITSGEFNAEGKSGNTDFCALNSKKGATTTVMGGSFDQKLNAAVSTDNVLHGGTYVSLDATPDAYTLGAGCTSSDAGGGVTKVTNAVSADINGATSTEVTVNAANAVKVNVKLTSGETTMPITKATIVSPHPEALTASVDENGNVSIIAGSNCPEDKYENLVVLVESGTTTANTSALNFFSSINAEETPTTYRATVTVTVNVESLYIAGKLTLTPNPLYIKPGRSLDVKAVLTGLESGISFDIASLDVVTVISPDVSEDKFQVVISGDTLIISTDESCPIDDYTFTVKAEAPDLTCSASADMLVKVQSYPSESSSSSGCNAGFAALALLAAAFAPTLTKRGRK